MIKMIKIQIVIILMILSIIEKRNLPIEDERRQKNAKQYTKHGVGEERLENGRGG